MLSYCTNVHPAEDLPGVLDQLDHFAVPIRERLGWDRLGLGIWLAAPVAAELAAEPASRRRLRAELTARGLAVVTMNAFPYGGFHDDVVKHRVFQPPWSDPARLRYTLDCVTVLSELLDEQAVYGSISTLPLGWREPWTSSRETRCAMALDELTRVLRTSEARAGRPIRLAVEPEPGSKLDNIAAAVDWLTGRVDPRFIGLCLDTCHLAVSFADPAAEVARIHAVGLDIVKVQLSAALELPDATDPHGRAALAGFSEPRYLHQVRERASDGTVHAIDDLPQAAAELPGVGTQRVHFHVPLHAEPTAPLVATTGVLRAALAAVTAVGPLPHLEVETYTWQVLPEPRGSTRVDVVAGTAAELDWANRTLDAVLAEERAAV
ncbi:sugar phosphate isomerase/epimerase [Tamaricihabitans halophyticus]|uniref:Sugar phosphate isomerase/epimerase n=1 Tax=Tamaricihabitans halophyticus TaxID=1262583 RepID=A0A4R2R264_9PSEU|nr:metabolite traffic protein EboE [Tamaricihabitans halophyticus]TCP56107.1 sugar phosphate isomerase/epimerase [Tamaricihabitans halophyticus]